MMRRGLAAGVMLALSSLLSAQAQPVAAVAGVAQNLGSTTALGGGTALPPPMVRNGQEILVNFREGLAAPECEGDATSPRWRAHFAHVPARLGNGQDDVLPLFGYVVDELRAANLPTEFALIPFVESGYRPGARSPSGPAGLWQFIASTARNHRLVVDKGFDARLSPVDSTRAAVRYLKTLHGMFAGDWRLAVMAYNAGEYRVLQSLRRAGMNAQNARPAELPGMSPITHAYVEKLHALACVLEHAETEGELMARLDRPVPVLQAHSVPAGTSLASWAGKRALDPSLVSRLNPALKQGRAGTGVLAPVTPESFLATLESPQETVTTVAAAEPPPPAPASAAASTSTTVTARERRHTVRNGESAWTIAKRYGIPVKALLAFNGLGASSVLKPGMVLRFQDKD